MTSSDDGGYVHDPSAFDDDGDSSGQDGDSSGQDGDSSGQDGDSFHDVHPATVDREFDWRGWVLVGVIFLALIVAPVIILLIPPDASVYRFALIVLPLFPAIALALTAIWATTRP